MARLTRKRQWGEVLGAAATALVVVAVRVVTSGQSGRGGDSRDGRAAGSTTTWTPTRCPA